MALMPPPIRFQALTEVSTVALRWLSSFDPFGPYGSRSR